MAPPFRQGLPGDGGEDFTGALEGIPDDSDSDTDDEGTIAPARNVIVPPSLLAPPEQSNIPSALPSMTSKQLHRVSVLA